MTLISDCYWFPVMSLISYFPLKLRWCALNVVLQFLIPSLRALQLLNIRNGFATGKGIVCAVQISRKDSCDGSMVAFQENITARNASFSPHLQLIPDTNRQANDNLVGPSRPLTSPPTTCSFRSAEFQLTLSSYFSRTILPS